MKTSMGGLVITLLVLSFVGWADQPALHPVGQWTVMIFMNAKDFGMDCAAWANLEELRAIGSSRDVNYVVELGREKGTACLSHNEPAWPGATQRYHIERGMSFAWDPKRRQDRDMGSSEHLAKFAEWGMRAFPARHYAVIIWSHGFGLAMPLIPMANDVQPRQDTLFHHFSASFDPDTKHYLYNRQVRDSLIGLFRNKKLDVLGYDACLMGGLESAYAMQEFAAQFVVSEQEENGASWNYGALAKHLRSHPGIGEKEFASAIVDGFGSKYSDPQYRTSMLAALDLGETQHVASAVSRFALAARSRLGDQTVRDAFFNTRMRRIVGYGPSQNPVDLVWLVEQLQMDPAITGELAQRAQEVAAAVQTFVTKRFVNSNEPAGNGSHGVSIYFPPDPSSFNDAYEGVAYTRADCNKPNMHPVQFVCCERWLDFLLAYLKLDPQPLCCH
jgi:hypothetical protein